MKALDRIIRARSILIQEQPFFGVLASHLQLVEMPECGTAATDGARLMFAPDFIATLSDPELLFVVAHEAGHCALQHLSRIGNRDMTEANIAADYALNRDLVAARIGKMPADGLLDAQYDGLGMEEIYAMRQAQKRKEQSGQKQGKEGEQGKPGANGQGEAQSAPSASPDAGQGMPGKDGTPQDGKPGQGDASGQGESDKPGQAAARNGIGGIMKPGQGTEAEAAEMADKWQVIARQAASIAKARNAGTLPGFAARVIDAISAPAVDYRELLAELINSKITVDYSFSRPNRRLIQYGFYLPGIVVDSIDHLIFAIDTSGSIDQTMLANAASEVIGAMESGKVRKLTVIFADRRVCAVQEFELGDDIALMPQGGGGTAFSDTFRWIEANASDATAVIYLTDLEVSDYGTEPAMPVFWAVHGDSRSFARHAAAVPFGEAIYIGRLG